MGDAGIMHQTIFKVKKKTCDLCVQFITAHIFYELVPNIPVSPQIPKNEIFIKYIDDQGKHSIYNNK